MRNDEITTIVQPITAAFLSKSSLRVKMHACLGGPRVTDFDVQKVGTSQSPEQL